MNNQILHSHNKMHQSKKENQLCTTETEQMSQMKNLVKHSLR